MRAQHRQVSLLHDAVELGGLTLDSRVVMAPMTRARSVHLAADDMTAQYYAQRASAGLIVSEGIPVSPQAVGHVALPAISTDEQIAGWRAVTDAVHQSGGSRMFAQLWHAGRMSHPSLQPAGAAPVGASDKAARDARVLGYTEDRTVGYVPAAPPRALTADEIPQLVSEFQQAAANAMLAGFDGIEIHAATGYIFEQFLNPNVNDRTGRYGGTVENRARLITEVVSSIADTIGPHRTAIRLSPFSELFDNPPYPEAEDTYFYLADVLSAHGLAYVHLHDLGWGKGGRLMSENFLTAFKTRFGGQVILCGGLTKDAAADLLGRGIIDLAAFGRPFIANPDLVARFRNDWPLAEPDQDTLYGGGAHGYTDYPLYVRVEST